MSAVPQRGMLLDSLRDVLYVVFRHKWVILGCFILVSCLVTAVNLVLPLIYVSEAKLLVRVGRENFPADASIETTTILNLSEERTSEVKSELAILSSRHLVEEVVTEIGEGWILGRMDLPRAELPLETPDAPGPLGRLVSAAASGVEMLLEQARLKAPLTPQMKAIEKVEKHLSVEVEEQTNIVTVSYEAKDPKLAQLILERLLDHYQRRHVEVFATTASPEFFEGQAEMSRKELERIEADLDAYRAVHGIADLTTQKQTLITELAELETQLSHQTAEVQALGVKVEGLQEKLANRSTHHEVSRTTGVSNLAADTLKQRLVELRLTEADLAARYPETHRPLVELREQIALLTQQQSVEPDTRTEVTTGLDETTEMLNREYETESVNLAAAEARLEKLRAEKAQYEEALTNLTTREMEFLRMTRDKELTEQEYRDYRDSLHQANISKALERDQISNVSVVQPASSPLAPVRPRKFRNIALGLLLGLFGGVALAFVIEFLDDSLNTSEAVEKRLGVPVLAAVSEREIEQCT